MLLIWNALLSFCLYCEWGSIYLFHVSKWCRDGCRGSIIGFMIATCNMLVFCMLTESVSMSMKANCGSSSKWCVCLSSLASWSRLLLFLFSMTAFSIGYTFLTVSLAFLAACITTLMIEFLKPSSVYFI